MAMEAIEAMRANPIAKLLTQIEQNTRSERTAVLYKTRQELGAEKVKVKIKANIYAITDIDNVKQEFTANLAVRARWKEPLMQGMSKTAEIDWDDQWNPRLELDNSVVIRNFDRKYELKYFKSDKEDKIPHVCLTMNISATFKEMFELDEFPLDYQALNIWIISEWPFSQLELIKDDEYKDHLSLCTFTESKEWYLYPQLIGEPVGEPQEIDETEEKPEQYPLYTITVQVKRLHQFYMWNHVFFMFALFLIGLSTFSIPYTDVGSRIIGAVLILLCALMYRLHMQPSLPIVAYWTALDKFNMAVLLCHILILMEHAVIGKIAQSPTISVVTQAGQADYACLGAIVCIMMIILIYFIAFFVQTLMKRNKFLEEETKNFEETNAEIEAKHGVKKDKDKNQWKYEAPPSDPMKRRVHPINGESPRLIHYQREEITRKSGRGQQALLPPLPPPSAANLAANIRMTREDYINPKEATHEMKIAMPPAVLEQAGRRSRSTSQTRGRISRSRNRVGSEQTQTETSDEE
ncbi:uncharacterized protein [Watersipora subatra]|uniref:uncharacterized protein n=1 Tax=Watersipora subatra TaxID=2589382 RepID=UPI00355B6C8D